MARASSSVHHVSSSREKLVALEPIGEVDIAATTLYSNCRARYEYERQVMWASTRVCVRAAVVRRFEVGTERGHGRHLEDFAPGVFEVAAWRSGALLTVTA
jgi:hypothetical protein